MADQIRRLVPPSTLRAVGGEWSVRLFKKLTTVFGCYAKDQSIAKSCDKTGFPERKSYAVTRYGFANACILVEEVKRGGDYFMAGWINAGSALPF